MKCDLFSVCKNQAVTNCVWGLYEPNGKTRSEKMNEANLCNDCSNKLWLSCAGAVNAGIIHWTNKEIKENKFESK